jgi:hypothetical protein
LFISPYYDLIPFRLAVFLASLSLYHYAEYLYVCCFHYYTLSFDSNHINLTLFKSKYLGFLLNHSKSYVVALVFGVIEYLIGEHYFNKTYALPGIIPYSIIALGFAMMIIGHYFRIGAEFTAGHSFNHRI